MIGFRIRLGDYVNLFVKWTLLTKIYSKLSLRLMKFRVKHVYHNAWLVRLLFLYMNPIQGESFWEFVRLNWLKVPNLFCLNWRHVRNILSFFYLKTGNRWFCQCLRKNKYFDISQFFTCLVIKVDNAFIMYRNDFAVIKMIPLIYLFYWY